MSTISTSVKASQMREECNSAPMPLWSFFVADKKGGGGGGGGGGDTSTEESSITPNPNRIFSMLNLGGVIELVGDPETNEVRTLSPDIVSREDEDGVFCDYCAATQQQLFTKSIVENNMALKKLRENYKSKMDASSVVSNAIGLEQAFVTLLLKITAEGRIQIYSPFRTSSSMGGLVITKTGFFSDDWKTQRPLRYTEARTQMLPTATATVDARKVNGFTNKSLNRIYSQHRPPNTTGGGDETAAATPELNWYSPGHLALFSLTDISIYLDRRSKAIQQKEPVFFYVMQEATNIMALTQEEMYTGSGVVVRHNGEFDQINSPYTLTDALLTYFLLPYGERNRLYLDRSATTQITKAKNQLEAKADLTNIRRGDEKKIPRSVSTNFKDRSFYRVDTVATGGRVTKRTWLEIVA